VTFFEIIANPGITTYALQQVAAHRWGAIPLISNVLTLRFLTGLVAALALFGFTLVVEPKTEIQRYMVCYGMASLVLES